MCDGNINPIGVVRLEGAASRAVRALQLDRRPEPEPMSIKEHLAAYGAVEPRQAREPSGRGGYSALPRNATYGQTSHRQRASCATTSTSDHGGRK